MLPYPPSPYVQTLEMLEKKERFLQKKCSAEIEKAKDYTKAKNKNGKEEPTHPPFLRSATRLHHNLSLSNMQILPAYLS